MKIINLKYKPVLKYPVIYYPDMTNGYCCDMGVQINIKGIMNSYRDDIHLFINEIIGTSTLRIRLTSPFKFSAGGWY